jgi:hypothetical protein
VLDIFAAVEQANAREANSDFAAFRGQIFYATGKPVLGAKLSLTAGLLQRRFPVSSYGPDERRDLLFNAGITVLVERVSALGVMPLTVFEFPQTKSNVALYDRRSFAVRMGFQSTF